MTFRGRVGALIGFLAVATAAVLGPSGLSAAQAQSGDAGAVTFTADFSSDGVRPPANESSVGKATLAVVEGNASTMAYDVTFSDRGRRIIGLRLHWTSAGGPGGVVAVLDHRMRTNSANGSTDLDGTFTSDVFTGPWAGLSIADFARRVEDGSVVVGVATEWGQSRFVDFLPVTLDESDASGGNPEVATFFDADETALGYSLTFDRPGRRVIGLRLHGNSAGGPGGVLAVLDHRARTERADGSTELSARFTSDVFTGPMRGRSIGDLRQRLNDDRIVVGIATEDLRGTMPGSLGRTVEYVPARFLVSADQPSAAGSATFTVAEDLSFIDYSVVVPDPGSRIIGLRLQIGCPRSVAAVLNHQNRTAGDDAMIEIAGTFRGDWQLYKSTPSLEQLEQLYVAVATEDDRLGATLCAPLSRSVFQGEPSVQ